MRLTLLSLCAFLLSCPLLRANDPTVLSAEAFLEIVKRNHPVAISARLENDRAAASLLKARGAFDPQLFGSTYWKQLDDKNYYRLWEAGIQAPLWPGMSLEAGYENNTGGFVNPEVSTVNNGMLFAGLSIPLLRGLTTDERRIAVKRSRLEVVRAMQVENIRLNDLLLDAAYAYWTWWLTSQLRDLQKETLQLSYDRWQFTRGVWQLGDVAAVDTLEAYVQWQNRKVDLQRAEIQYIRASYRLSNFMWDENGNPLFLNDNVVPQQADEQLFRTEMLKVQQLNSGSEVKNHPLLRSLTLRREQQDLDLRLNREMLKPVLNVKYNFLTTPRNDAGLSLRDYRFGAGMYIPLAYRKQRADIRMTQINQLETDLQLMNQELQFRNNRETLANTIVQVADNLGTFGSITTNLDLLLKAEQEKFNLGESTVFLLNARENQYLQSMQNWYQLHYDLISNLYLWRWFIGDMSE